jgi:flagellar biosynthesis/type III secretory pathway ATPase
MLSKKSYRQVVKGLENLKAQDAQDRKESPHATPIDWKSSIARLIEHVVRENRERFVRGSEEETMQYLEKKGLLVPYCGGYSFPGKDLPSEEEIRANAASVLRRLG